MKNRIALVALIGLVMAGATTSSRALAHDSAEAGPAAPQSDSSPAVAADPALARMRLKNLVRESFRQGLSDQQAPERQEQLDKTLAMIDAMSDGDALAAMASIGPVMGLTRTLDALAAAADDASRTSTVTAVAQDDPAVEILRRDIDAYLARFVPYNPVVQSRYPEYGVMLSGFRNQIQSMDARDLARLVETFNQIPSARGILAVDPAAIIGQGGSPPQRAASPDRRQRPDGLDAGSIHTLSSCADATFGPVATGVMQAIAEAAEEVKDLLWDDLMIGNINLPNPVRIVAAVIALPLWLLALSMRADLDVFLACNDNAHQTLTEMHKEESEIRLEAMKSMLNDSTKITDLKRTIANRADRMDVYAVEFRKLTLRLDIEKDLLRMGDPRISLFQIPQSVCITVGEHQSCGQLETVRDIVADTILDNRSLGFDTTLASVALADGESQRALGLYKEAYTRYRYAYQLAVRSR
ncbi:MAG: hypothetical protein IPJ58_06725 [Ardenticatenia bacterium]|nr:hypothetical protein [Ardenticatenia bacterium]